MIGVKWKIWFGDGSTWCDEDGPPELSPATNVQAVRYVDLLPGVIDIVYKVDWYYWIDGYPTGSNVHPKYDPISSQLKVHGIKEGKFLTHEEFAALMKVAYADPYIPMTLSERPRVRVPAR